MRTSPSCTIVALCALTAPLGLAPAARAARAEETPPQAIEVAESSRARIEFDHPGSGTPMIEVDLPAGMLSDLTGLGDAAIAGVADALAGAQLTDGELQGEVRLASEQLAAIRSILAAVQGAIGEVRVRGYEGKSEQTYRLDAIAEHYTQKLRGSEWSKIVQVRDGDEGATVFIMRESGALRGVFVIATEGDGLLLANVLCDISPERIKQITHQATSMGLELGGEEALRKIVGELRGR